MNAAAHYTPESNPTAVLQRIDSAAPADDLTDLIARKTPRGGTQQPSGPTHLRLHIDSDIEVEADDQLDLAHPPTKQVEQLIRHLREQQKQLAQREADLQSQAQHWDEQVLASKAHLQSRTAEIKQQATQVQQQQLHLARLQQNLIDSQTALRTVIERIVSDSEPGKLKIELIALRDELDQRFEQIAVRWERFAKFL